MDLWVFLYELVSITIEYCWFIINHGHRTPFDIYILAAWMNTTLWIIKVVKSNRVLRWHSEIPPTTQIQIIERFSEAICVYLR